LTKCHSYDEKIPDFTKKFAEMEKTNWIKRVNKIMVKRIIDIHAKPSELNKKVQKPAVIKLRSRKPQLRPLSAATGNDRIALSRA
jgi:hypothetical protein